MGKKKLFYETEVPQVKTVKMVVFWDVMLCTLLDHISSTLKVGAMFSFEMMIITQLSNEISPTVKLCDFNVFFFPPSFSLSLSISSSLALSLSLSFAQITDLKSILRYHLNFPRNRHI